jgi:hypothetical protein
MRECAAPLERRSSSVGSPAVSGSRSRLSRVMGCMCPIAAAHRTRLSYYRFRPNEVRLLLGVTAYNLGNLLR